jgi:hypothetical protein
MGAHLAWSDDCVCKEPYACLVQTLCCVHCHKKMTPPCKQTAGAASLHAKDGEHCCGRQGCTCCGHPQALTLFSR